ncbi:MAG: 4Fe-4S dicluster domain-containing protein [Planctomycetota bacterium]|jgi:Fe-S-cluster-containing dehydrogenase component
MQYGFVIDHDSCIGCHACTVACKAENDVPVGAFRTWVKYLEQGTFPDVKRHFLVQRCNHCSDAPCVTICPVNALEKRADGIVDIDRDACIGCRACMQACPYDAIYLNEDHGAVEKCHFCAHRVEQGLEPACAVVCPVDAIIAGDLDDPGSRAAGIVRDHETVVRRPEQGTRPNVHYKGAAPLALQPGAAMRPPTYLWSDRPAKKPEAWPISLPLAPDSAVVLDTDHRVEWGSHISAYLVTKGVAGGVAMLAPFGAKLGLTGVGLRWMPEVIALVFTIVTLFLLVHDLARPMLFYRLLTRPNWKSWLVKGGVVLGAFAAVVSAILAARATGFEGAADALRWVAAPLGAGVAGYTAFLFAQCKGRDLWESGMLLPHLLVQALLCGSACLLQYATDSLPLKVILAISVLVHGGLALAERFRPHETDNARQAAGFLGTVRFGPSLAFRDGLILGVGVALVMIVFAPAWALFPALIGLALYEHAFVRAGQLPPLS